MMECPPVGNEPHSGMTWRLPTRQESCHLAWKLKGLRGSSPHDQRLQKLKERILEQRQQCHFRALGEKGPTRSHMGGPLATPPLKRKVCKANCAPPAPARPAQPLTLRPKGGNASPRKRTKEDPGANLCGVSAWREGLKLARKILGPPPEYSKLRSGSAQGATELATGSEAGCLMRTPAEQSLRRTCQPAQSEMEEMEGTKEARELDQMGVDWESPRGVNCSSRKIQKVPDLEKRAANEKRPTRRKGNIGPGGASIGVRSSQSPEVKDAPTNAPLEDQRASSTNRHDRTTTSSQRSDHSGKENQSWPELCSRRHSYSPEQVHEFMKRKVAERNRKSQEEKRSLRQAREARNIRLQEVYRKQREAFGRKTGWTEAPQFQGGATPALGTKHNRGSKHVSNSHPGPEVPEWLHRTSCALLCNEVKSYSDLHPARTSMAEWTRRLDSPLSLAPEGSTTSPLNLEDLLVPSSPTACDPRSPFLWPKRSTEDTPTSSNTLGLSPYRNKQDRVRAIHVLAQSLGERLEREMERLQGRNMLLDSRDQGRPLGTPYLPERPHPVSKPEVPQKEFAVTAHPSALLHLGHSQSPSTCGQNRQGGAGLSEGSVTRAPPEGIQPPVSVVRSANEVLPAGSSPEERLGVLHTKGLKNLGTGGAEDEEGFQRDGGPLPRDPPAQHFVPPPPPQFLTRRFPLSPPTSSQADCNRDLHQNTAMDVSSSKTHLGERSGASPQQWHQAPGPSPGPAGKMCRSKSTAPGETGDGSDAADSTSQWSEMSRFYGGSSTFCHFGLKMAEQYLREEELRARHQSALLRLRDKALQERATAELAWLEHEKRGQHSLRDAEGASATTEKQHRLLTRLKQEQAEIQHLQNVGKAAHRERKLLLRQQKDLLLVQQSTSQLWQRLCKLSGTIPQQEAGNPASSEGTIILGEEWGEEVPSFAAPFVATCSGRSGNRSSQSPRQGGTNRRETKEIVPQGKRAAEEFLKWRQDPGNQDAKSPEMTAEDLLSSREYPVGSALKAGSTEMADNLVSKEEEGHCEDNGLINSSKVDYPHNSLDKGPEFLSPAVSFSKSYGFSPDLENSQFSPEFQKAHAILVDISGSSLSASDLEADDAEDTDVSLPEEFTFQEEPHDSCGTAVFCDVPTVPEVAVSMGSTLASSGRRCHIQASCGHSSPENLSFMGSQEKTLEDTSHGDGIYESDSGMLASNGKPRPNSSWSEEALSFQDQASIARRNATSLKSKSGNKMASQGTPVSEVALSPGMAAAPHPSEDQRWWDTVPAIHIVEVDTDCENTFDFTGKCKAKKMPPDVSLRNADSTNDPFQGSPFRMTGSMPLFPLVSLSSSENGLVSASGIHSAECSADGHESRRPDEDAAQVSKPPAGHEEAGISVLCPKTTAGTAQENQSSPPTNSRNNSPHTGKLFQAKSCLPGCKDDIVFLNRECLPEMEDDISSPVDEMLSYGSTDLPSSTEKDASFQCEDLPAPPEDLDAKSDDSNFSLQDFPPPPELLVFPETGELLHSTDGVASIEIGGLPSLSDLPGPGGPPSPPAGLTGVSSASKLPLGQ